MDDLIIQLDIETDVMNLRKEDTDQAGNDRNITGKVNQCKSRFKFSDK
jgi:hypothetical protein